MKIQIRSRNARKAPLMATLALACALVAGNAGAGIPVTDVGNMATHIMNQIQAYLNQINTVTQKIQDAQEYAETARNRLLQLQHIFSASQLAFTKQFQKRSEMEGIEERCQGGSGNMLSDLISSFGLNMNGDIVAQQKALCTYIVIMQNKKYNDQVDAMNKLLQDTQNDIKRQIAELKSSEGTTAVSTNQATAAANIQQVLANYQQSQQRIQMYDSIIGTLKDDQKELARRALKGDNGSSMIASAAGAVVSTLALKGALMINESDARCTRSGNNISCD
ncbi:MAG: hypothetical protein ACTHOH_09800 [Lysobacteraceae bacterium]